MHTLWLRLWAISKVHCWTEHDFEVALQKVCPWIIIRVGQEGLGISHLEVGTTFSGLDTAFRACPAASVSGSSCGVMAGPILVATRWGIWVVVVPGRVFGGSQWLFSLSLARWVGADSLSCGGLS